jgi:phosphatidylinositol alpha-mannosyltransferase
MDRSRILSAGYGLAQTVLEKLTARIAVSELARSTVVEHVGGDAVLIPNGIYVNNFASAQPRGGSRDTQRIAFLGRFDEPRKGFSIVLDAFLAIADEFPQATLVVAGPGDSQVALKDVEPALASRIEFLGRVSDQEKAEMLASAGMYIAPNTGGESFGIVLLEAMACHTPVIASDLPAFARVLDFGKAGKLFPNGDSSALAASMAEVLAQPRMAQDMAEAGWKRVQEFDWSRVASQVIDVYATVTSFSEPVQEDLRGQIVGRLGSHDS